MDTRTLQRIRNYVTFLNYDLFPDQYKAFIKTLLGREAAYNDMSKEEAQTLLKALEAKYNKERELKNKKQ